MCVFSTKFIYCFYTEFFVKACLSSAYYFLVEEYVVAASQYNCRRESVCSRFLPVLAAVPAAPVVLILYFTVYMIVLWWRVLSDGFHGSYEPQSPPCCGR